MKIILTGLPYFIKNLSYKLNNFSNKHKFISLNTNGNKKHKLLFLLHIITAKVLYFHSSGIDRSFSADIALFFRKKVIMNWAGTDVLTALENYKTNNYKKKYIEKIEHYCVAPWLQKELKTIGINAEILPVTVLDKSKNKKLEFPEKITILTYIGKNREEFYGINTIIKLANQFKEINFRIVGINSYKNINKENIEMIGWVENMNKEYENCTAYLRDTKHDGMPFTIIEALSYGKPVIYNKEYPFVETFNNYNELEKIIRNIITANNNNKLEINYKAIEFIEKEYDEKKILGNLINKFTE